MKDRENLMDMVSGFAQFLLNYDLCTLTEKKVAIDLFSTFASAHFIEYCLSCKAKHYLTEYSVFTDDMGRHAICRECESSFNIQNQ